VVRRAIYKITEQYLPGVIQEEIRQVNGTPKKHYRIEQEELMRKIFPQYWIRHKRRIGVSH
jgi:hypothetical protein